MTFWIKVSVHVIFKFSSAYKRIMRIILLSCSQSLWSSCCYMYSRQTLFAILSYGSTENVFSGHILCRINQIEKFFCSLWRGHKQHNVWDIPDRNLVIICIRPKVRKISKSWRPIRPGSYPKGGFLPLAWTN